MFRYVVSGLMGVALAPAAHAAANCSGDLTPPPLPLPSTVLEPVAGELFSRSVQLGVPSGVLTQGNDVSQSVDRVLLRLRADGCRELAKAAPAAVGANPDDPAAYKPKTAFDNTPWRFDMNQNGKRIKRSYSCMMPGNPSAQVTCRDRWAAIDEAERFMLGRMSP